MGELKMQGTPSLGTVLGAIGALLGLAALVVSLSASADASSNRQLVRRGDIAPGAVTAKALARNAVHPRSLARNAVHSKALAKEAVNRRVLRKGAVLARAIAPARRNREARSRRARCMEGRLGAETVHATPITDIDEVEANPQMDRGQHRSRALRPRRSVAGPRLHLRATRATGKSPGSKPARSSRVTAAAPTVSAVGSRPTPAAVPKG